MMGKRIKKLLMVTEGSPKVGLGHLVECESIVNRLREHGSFEGFFIINKDFGAERFMNSKNLNYGIYEKIEALPPNFFDSFDAFLINVKRVEYNLLEFIKKFGKKLIVIDELGNKKITGDLLVNFSVNSKRHCYEFPLGKPKTLFGPEYFPASQSVHSALGIPKPENSNTIIVSLGGYGSPQVMEKVLTVLREFTDFNKEVILGPGFHAEGEWNDFIKSFDNSFLFYENVTDLPQRIRKSKFIINSGGNTVYESVIVGTPVLVIGEDPHEIEQGDIFQKSKWGLNIDVGQKADIDLIRNYIHLMCNFKCSEIKPFVLKNWFEFIS